MEACLVVHERSIPYIKNVATALTEALKDVFSSDSRMVACTSVDSADIGEAEVIFIIGENLDRFKRLAGLRYIYLNFSVVTMLGNPLQNSIHGFRLIRYKHLLLRRKLDLFDALLDYYPPQTRHLVKSMNLPVFGFVPYINPVSHQHSIPFKDRLYDVCFVGGLSTRRKNILKKLQEAGYALSPSSGVEAEDIAAQSRITINIHKEKSNHLEIPRVIGALASSSPVITEDSYGLLEILPKGIVQTSSYANLVNKTIDILANPRQLDEYAEFSQRWYCEVGAPRFKNIFTSALKEIQLFVRSK